MKAFMLKHLLIILLAGHVFWAEEIFASSVLPEGMKNVGIEDRLGAQVPLTELEFTDESGKKIHLQQLMRPQLPVVLSITYYNCPGLCGLVLNGVVDGLKELKKVGWQAGKQFVLINVSMDSRETHELAQKKKENFIQTHSSPEWKEYWHFLTGSEASIQKLTQTIGFQFKWIPQEKQFSHGAGIFILTPEGVVSRVLYGIQYRTTDLKLSLLEASRGKVGTIIDRILLFCYQYDPQLGKYSMVLMRVLKLGALLTVLSLGVFLGLFWFRSLSRRNRGVA